MYLHIPIHTPIPLLFLGCLYGTTDSLTYLFSFFPLPHYTTLHYTTMPPKTLRSLQTSKGLRVLNLLYCIQSKGQIRSPGCENEEQQRSCASSTMGIHICRTEFLSQGFKPGRNYDGNGIEFRSENGVRDKKNGASEECPNWQACRR